MLRIANTHGTGLIPTSDPDTDIPADLLTSTGRFHHLFRPGGAGEGVVHGLRHLLEALDPQVRVGAGGRQHPAPDTRALQLRLHLLPGQ